MNMHFLNKVILTGLVGLGFLSVSVMSQAATESVSADVEFVTPIGLVEANQMAFGLISTDIATETLILATTDTVSGTGTAFQVGGTAAAAEVTVTAASVGNIDIIIDTIVPGTGYTLGAFTCKYTTGAETGCSSTFSPPAGTGGALLIGATLTANGTDVAGLANGTFVVNVTYP